MNQTQYKNEKRFISRLKGNLTKNMRECYDVTVSDNKRAWNQMSEDSKQSIRTWYGERYNDESPTDTYIVEQLSSDGFVLIP